MKSQSLCFCHCCHTPLNAKVLASIKLSGIAQGVLHYDQIYSFFLKTALLVEETGVSVEIIDNIGFLLPFHSRQ